VDKEILWEEFCETHTVLESSVPLFATNGAEVRLTKYRTKDPVPVLTRSLEMERMIRKESAKITDDHKTNGNRYGGAIYLMFRVDGRRVVPLYIGKTEKHGKKGGNLSANLATGTVSAKFCRWGYDYAYHLGDLSAVTCLGHALNKRPPKYVRWAERLFESFPTDRPKLRHDIRFWIKAWPIGETGIWKEFGPTSLTFLEYLLIGVASDVYPDDLLNSEGVNRA
jgi:hypothetical protein